MANVDVTVQMPTLPAAHPIQAALEAPYTLTRWREEVAQLAEGASTGLAVLEDLRMRWHPGKVYAVAARPGGGKTAFMLEACVRYLEKNPTGHALFLSWEEPLADVVLRLVLRADAKAMTPNDGDVFSGQPIYRDTVRAFVRDPDGPFHVPNTRERLEAAQSKVAALLNRLHLVDGDALGHDIRKVLEHVGQWMREKGAHKIGLVAVDYFQKLRGPREHPAFSRQGELQLVSEYLRRFAKGATLAADGDVDEPDPSFAVPVLVGAQVTRGQGEHPTGDGIREADDLLNDAAVVITLSYEVTAGAGTDEVRKLRVSVPKHRAGRARGDEVAGMLWVPGRDFFEADALRDSAGVIAWAPIPKSEGQGTTPPRAKRDKDVR